MSIFNFKSEKLVSINLIELLKGQIPINNKFPNPNRGTKFVNVFDNMVGQIEEEIYETREAIYNNKKDPSHVTKDCYQDTNSLEEFIDSIMYTGSLIIETANTFNINIIEYLTSIGFTEIDISDFYVPNYIEDKHRNYPNESYLSYMRRKIYDRKYHKPAGEKPEDYEKNFIIELIVSAFLPRQLDMDYASKYEKYKIPPYIDNMNPYIQDVVFCYDNGWHSDDTRRSMIAYRINDLNTIIENKQKKISNL